MQNKKNTWFEAVTQILQKYLNEKDSVLLDFTTIGNTVFDYHLRQKNTIPYLFDNEMGGFIVVGKSVEYILGFQPEAVINGGREFIITHFQKEDLQFIQTSVQQERLMFLQEIPILYHFNYLFTSSFRFKNAAGEYVQLLDRNSIIVTDKKGQALVSFGTLMHIDNLKLEKPSFQRIEKIHLLLDQPIRKIKVADYCFNQNLVLQLSRREKEVLRLIIDGLTSKEIAHQLFISEYTVVNHRKKMLQKTGANNMAQLTAMFLKGNMV